ncbi:hypothetical protein KH5_13330 [Urechidicola sp. KH5]
MSIEKNVLYNATRIYLGIVAFFFLMKFLNLEQITELRILNFLIVFWGINVAIKNNATRNFNSTYLHNLFIGFFTSFIAVVLTSVSLNVYLFYIDPSFITVLEGSTLWGASLTPPLMSVALLIEGLASSIICSFIVMQYWKNKSIAIDM